MAKKKAKTTRAKQAKSKTPALSEAVDPAVELLVCAYRKRLLGLHITVRERDALRKHDREVEQGVAARLYRSIPKGDWARMAGRQHKVVNDQGKKYGLPLDGPTIDLNALAPALHDFLAEHARQLGSTEGEDPMSGPDSPALEKWRQEKYLLARLDRLEREGRLIERDAAHEALVRIAQVLRGVGDNLQRSFGPDSAKLLHAGLDQCQTLIDTMFIDHDRTDEDKNKKPAHA